MKDIFKISVGGGGGHPDPKMGAQVVPVSKKFFWPFRPHFSLGDPLDRHWFLVLNNFWVTQYNCSLLNDLFYLFIFK